jgi:hypothetical protein
MVCWWVPFSVVAGLYDRGGAALGGGELAGGAGEVTTGGVDELMALMFHVFLSFFFWTRFFRLLGAAPYTMSGDGSRYIESNTFLFVPDISALIFVKNYLFILVLLKNMSNFIHISNLIYCLHVTTQNSIHQIPPTHL